MHTYQSYALRIHRNGFVTLTWAAGLRDFLAFPEGLGKACWEDESNMDVLPKESC
jgi:hypothetical protein